MLDDQVATPRGFALKVIGVQGERRPGKPTPFVSALQRGDVDLRLRIIACITRRALAGSGLCINATIMRGTICHEPACRGANGHGLKHRPLPVG